MVQALIQEAQKDKLRAHEEGAGATEEISNRHDLHWSLCEQVCSTWRKQRPQLVHCTYIHSGTFALMNSVAVVTSSSQEQPLLSCFSALLYIHISIVQCTV